MPSLSVRAKWPIPLSMGTKGVRQIRRETPDSLRSFARELEEVAKSLRSIADRMQIKRINYVEVRNSPGAHSELVRSIKPFALDAEKKAAKAGA
jgi:hypothetical protein